MGDFSVPCCLSGLPIARGQRAVAIAVRPLQWDGDEYRCGPVAMPIEGEMGDYGEIDADTSSFSAKQSIVASHRAKLPGSIHIVHAHVAMYDMAAELYTKAMPSKLTLFEELKLELWEYYEKKAKDPKSPYAKLKEEYYSDPQGGNRMWLSLFNKIISGVAHPDTFRSELHEVLDDWCLRDHVKNHEEDINALQKLIAVFCAQRLIGRVILPVNAYCFEQYPTFKWEEKWAHAVWKMAKESKTRVSV